MRSTAAAPCTREQEDHRKEKTGPADQAQDVAGSPGLRVLSTSGDRSKPASGGRVKTGQSIQDGVVYRAIGQDCKSLDSFVRQLRGPHLRTWAWWSSRSSIAVTAAVSPSSLPQSSTGRFEVSNVDTRS